jgi:hypothetical protein
MKRSIRGLRHTRLELRPRSTWRNTRAVRKGEATRNPLGKSAVIWEEYVVFLYMEN